MCTGYEAYAAYAAAAAATAASVYSANEQSKAQDAQRRAAEEAATAESIRQTNFNREKMALVDEALNEADPVSRDEQIEQVTAARLDLLKPTESDLRQTAETGGITSVSAPKEINDDLARAVSTASQRASNFQKTLAKMGSYGQSTANNARALNRTAQNVGVLDNLSSGSLGVLDSELAMSKYAGQGHLNNASTGQVVGSLANMYALYGGGTGSATKKATGLTNTSYANTGPYLS